MAVGETKEEAETEVNKVEMTSSFWFVLSD